MNTTIDIEAIRGLAKQKWLKENRRNLSFRERLGNSVPLWIIILTAVLFGLSAPHTAAMFNQLTPVLGTFAPLAFEFGLLYAAFRRKHIQYTKDKIPGILWLLEVLLFFTSILVNGAGSLTAVARSAGIEQMSFAAIWDGFGTFPIVAQVALLLVPFAALIIPIGTAVTGEGLAALVIEERSSEADLEAKWREVEKLETTRAAYAYLLRQGDKPDIARRRAMSAVQNLSTVERQIEAGNDNVIALPIPASVSGADRPRGHSGREDKRGTKADVVKYLKVNGGRGELSVRELAKITRTSKTTAHEAITEWESSRED